MFHLYVVVLLLLYRRILCIRSLSLAILYHYHFNDVACKCEAKFSHLGQYVVDLEWRIVVSENFATRNSNGMIATLLFSFLYYHRNLIIYVVVY